jgi:integrase
MAVVKRKGSFYLYFRPFKTKMIGVHLPDGVGKIEGKRIEAALITACRSGNYHGLDSVTREICIKMFVNQKWELPEGLGGIVSAPTEELTLWKAAELFFKHPDIKDNPGRWRHENAMVHFLGYFGKGQAIKKLWIPQLKLYRTERLAKGMKPSTVNREMATLSRLFGVLIEHQLVDVNPCRLVKRLSERSLQRQVYISFEDMNRIVDVCPDWYKPIIQVGYYSGMRKGEILSLKRDRVKLSQRMVLIAPEDTKENAWKRVPLRKELIPVFEQSLKVTSLQHDHVFLLNDKSGIRPVNSESVKNLWRRQIPNLGFESKPRFHDFRHTWRANARRSGMDPVIAETILGHWNRERSVNERYGRLSDEELLRAVDSMTFDNGVTEIVVSQGG